MNLDKNRISGSVILVTGGAGFIGSYLAEELLKHSPAKIVIIDNLIRGSLENMKGFIQNPLVEFIEGDINDEILLEKCISGSDYIFHMAALRINACAANPSEGFDVMVKSTFKIAELSRKYKIKKLIYSSSASVYGYAQNFPTPESDNPYDNQTFYGAAKLFGEQLFRSYKHMFGLDYIALRYFNVYGPRMDTDGKYTEVMIKWLDSIRDDIPPLVYGDGSTTMDFVYVKDVAAANVAALISDVSDESFNIGNSIETSLKDLLDLVLKINHSSLKPVFIESNTVNPVSRRLSDNSKAKKLLGFSPKVNLEEGIKKLSEWYFKKTKTLSQ
ncbi:MAG: NAD-dependent epimerase/dehydratase family protein [Ignavibacteria bacterium]|nr:NAD-dependent epimerase/dehydratase family protein [Ignavibacteria bacterium]